MIEHVVKQNEGKHKKNYVQLQESVRQTQLMHIHNIFYLPHLTHYNMQL